MQVAYRSHLSLAIVVLLCCTVVRAGNPAAVLDFDGDGKTDYVVVRSEIPSGSGFKLVWYINGSQMGMRGYQWGLDGMALVPADYDGDGKWDIAVWTITGPEGSPAYFHIYRSSDNTYQRIQWGATDDDPRQTQDFDGDGKADPTVVRLESGTGRLLWYSLLSMTGEVRAVQFGGPDRPLRGDFDGDGKADLAVYRTQFGEPASTFIFERSSDRRIEFYHFGNAETDRVVPADFDGDGKTDYTILRLIDTKHWWFWVESSTGEFRSQQFGHTVEGISFDGAVPGDYDGDGKSDLAVFRRPDSGIRQGYFYVDRSRDGMVVTPWGFGVTENIPASVLQVR
jgi:hypothetical protein